VPKLVAVADAIDAVRRGAPLMPARPVALDKAAGRVLAQDVIAMRDQPPFNASAMDGYAVRLESLTDEASLRLIGESQAGHGFRGVVGVGEAVRILTGAPVPAGAETIVIQENTRIAPDGWLDILPDGRAAGRRHIRPAGQDFRAGDTLLAAGQRLDAWRLALVAAAGRAEAQVRRRPRIAILCTGDELVAPGEAPGPDQIYESASAALIALVEGWGGRASFAGTRGDDLKSIRKALRLLLKTGPDLIVTLGGASVGDLDLVRPALDAMGLDRDFDSVKVRPGKPTAFGHLPDGTGVLILPGNPASAMVMAQLLLKTWISAALGTVSEPAYVTAALTASLPAVGPREAFLRGRLAVSAEGRLQVSVFSDQDSSLVSVFARADALVRLPGDAPDLPEGAPVQVLPLQRLQG